MRENCTSGSEGRAEVAAIWSAASPDPTPAKLPNNAAHAAAEAVEGRGLREGNAVGKTRDDLKAVQDAQHERRTQPERQRPHDPLAVDRDPRRQPGALEGVSDIALRELGNPDTHVHRPAGPRVSQSKPSRAHRGYATSWPLTLLPSGTRGQAKVPTPPTLCETATIPLLAGRPT